MSEPRKTRGTVERITYRYKSASSSGYTQKSISVRDNRTMRETQRQIERMRRNYPAAFVDSDRAYSTALRTFDALGLTGRGERPANARITRRTTLPRRNNRG